MESTGNELTRLCSVSFRFGYLIVNVRMNQWAVARLKLQAY